VLLTQRAFDKLADTLSKVTVNVCGALEADRFVAARANQTMAGQTVTKLTLVFEVFLKKWVADNVTD
jgi:hypothetical protein